MKKSNFKLNFKSGHWQPGILSFGPPSLCPFWTLLYCGPSLTHFILFILNTLKKHSVHFGPTSLCPFWLFFTVSICWPLSLCPFVHPFHYGPLHSVHFGHSTLYLFFLSVLYSLYSVFFGPSSLCPFWTLLILSILVPLHAVHSFWTLFNLSFWTPFSLGSLTLSILDPLRPIPLNPLVTVHFVPPPHTIYFGPQNTTHTLTSTVHIDLCRTHWPLSFLLRPDVV